MFFEQRQQGEEFLERFQKEEEEGGGGGGGAAMLTAAPTPLKFLERLEESGLTPTFRIVPLKLATFFSRNLVNFGNTWQFSVTFIILLLILIGQAGLAD